MAAQARLLGGRYQVGELLGYGGMAEVHAGRDIRLGRDIAVKMLREDLSRDWSFQERFRLEARNTAALNHPSIVAVYDIGEQTTANGERLPFIVMELVVGRTLKEALAAEGWFPARAALEITADLCAALEFSHRHGIVHRDVKPGNVMVTRNSQVKVMDFGIAHAMADPSGMTSANAVIGTAQYLSPEQARGERVDARSDVYAAGCVLFELLTGRPPFVGDSPVSVAYQHVREEPSPPGALNPQVTPPVDGIVLMALQKDPARRYQSAQEMRADILRAVSNQPVLAATTTSVNEPTLDLRPPPGPAPTAAARKPGGWWRNIRMLRMAASDDTPPIVYIPVSVDPSFGGQSIAQLEAVHARLNQQIDEALARRDWETANRLRATASSVLTEIIRKFRAEPERKPPDTPPRPATGKIFICYRRDDSRHSAARLSYLLGERFGRESIFIDVDNVPIGADFVDEVRREVGSCKALLAVIGPQWANAKAQGRRRLDDPDDLVVLEIQEALTCRVPVIPVLVDDARMPRLDQLPAGLKPLTRRNALPLGHDTFRTDAAPLIAVLEKVLAPTTNERSGYTTTGTYWPHNKDQP
uniref:protein kinase domain-containing protein n=1 Tax=Paractinoplanes polyasparticus TaxID=2856853 RepID=UPI001C8605BB|nr:protein kinase [Actinoplanes polyasparticus]